MNNYYRAEIKIFIATTTFIIFPFIISFFMFQHYDDKTPSTKDFKFMIN
jgi:hypothetical protein